MIHVSPHFILVRLTGDPEGISRTLGTNRNTAWMGGQSFTAYQAHTLTSHLYLVAN